MGGVGESCEVSEGGQECKDRSTEDNINQVTLILSSHCMFEYDYVLHRHRKWGRGDRGAMALIPPKICKDGPGPLKKKSKEKNGSYNIHIVITRSLMLYSAHQCKVSCFHTAGSTTKLWKAATETTKHPWVLKVYYTSWNVLQGKYVAMLIATLLYIRIRVYMQT